MRVATTLMLALSAAMMTGDVFGLPTTTFKIGTIEFLEAGTKICTVDTSQKLDGVVLVQAGIEGDATEVDYTGELVVGVQNCAKFETALRPKHDDKVDFALVYGESKGKVVAARDIKFTVKAGAKTMKCGDKHITRSPKESQTGCINDNEGSPTYCYMHETSEPTGMTCGPSGDTCELTEGLIVEKSVTLNSLAYSAGTFNFDALTAKMVGVIVVVEGDTVPKFMEVIDGAAADTYDGELGGFARGNKHYTLCPVTDTSFGSTEFTDIDVIGLHEAGHYQFGFEYDQSNPKKMPTEIKAYKEGETDEAAKVAIDCSNLIATSPRCYGYMETGQTNDLTISYSVNSKPYKIIVDGTSIIN